MAYCGLAPDGHENRSLNEVDVGLGPISKIRQPLMGQTHGKKIIDFSRIEMYNTFI